MYSSRAAIDELVNSFEKLQVGRDLEKVAWDELVNSFENLQVSRDLEKTAAFIFQTGQTGLVCSSRAAVGHTFCRAV